MKKSRWFWLILLALAFLSVLLFKKLCWDDPYGPIPGIGFTVTQFVLSAAVLLMAKAEEKLRFTRSGIFLLAAALLLGASFSIFASYWLRLINLPLTVMLTAQAFFSLTGQNEQDGLSGKGLWEGFRRFFSSLFRHMLFPFRTFLDQFLKNRPAGVALGILIALPMLFVVLMLLGDADQMFESLLKRCSSVFSLGGIGDILFILFFTLILFSLLYSMLAEKKPLKDPVLPKAAPATFLIALSVLSLVYAVFGYVQIKYLFLGKEAVQMQGGYAEYARSGFFQMVFVALITILLELPALALCGESRAVRGLCALVSGLTLLIDVSAFLRMRMYILSFGLSILRVLTLWAMLMIAGTLALILIKCFNPQIKLCPLAAILILTGWVALNYSNADQCIAAYNINAYNEGRLEELDTGYLIYDLSPDAYPALQKIQDEELRRKTMKRFRLQYRDKAGAYLWSLSWNHMKE